MAMAMVIMTMMKNGRVHRKTYFPKRIAQALTDSLAAVTTTKVGRVVTETQAMLVRTGLAVTGLILTIEAAILRKRTRLSMLWETHSLLRCCMSKTKLVSLARTVAQTKAQTKAIIRAPIAAQTKDPIRVLTEGQMSVAIDLIRTDERVIKL